MVGNVGLRPAKTFECRRVTRDVRNGGPLEILIIAKLLHQFSNLMFNLNFASNIYKYVS